MFTIGDTIAIYNELEEMIDRGIVLDITFDTVTIRSSFTGLSSEYFQDMIDILQYNEDDVSTCETDVINPLWKMLDIYNRFDILANR